MHVIGTAGHIDHGKSTLIRALTGTDPDRLREEKERGMTIDLGFAWIALPGGQEAGIVDVPGHHRFVPNMLAGVGGVDLVLFVVAATEGWMPQSEEHLAIIDLLDIRRGLVVVTKVDLVEPDWLEMAVAEVQEKLSGSSLAGAELVPVSSTTGQGIEHLKGRIDVLLREIPPAPDLGRPRLWVDRVFTIHGAGTVVTGTLEGGSLQLDQPVSVLPGELPCRVRGLQTHKRAVEKAIPGSRVAVNLAGVDRDSLQRGYAITAMGQKKESDTINVALRLLESLDYSLPERCTLKLYVGSAELEAAVRLLDRLELLPGESGLAQVVLESGAAFEWHDRFILRDATRQHTVGGGRVLDVHAERVRGRDLRMSRAAPGAYRVLSPARVPVRRLDLGLLAARQAASPESLISLIVRERGWVACDELLQDVPLAPAKLREELLRLGQNKQLLLLPSYAVDLTTWRALGERIEGELAAYHERFPLRAGLGRETLRSSLRMDAKLYEEAVAALVEHERLEGSGALLRLAGFEPRWLPAQRAEAAKIEELLVSRGFGPPELDQLTSEFGFDAEVVNALLEQGRLVKVGRGLVYLDETLAAVKGKVAAAIRAAGTLEVGAMREVLGTTRKYSVPLLEYLDQTGVTRRVGDKRVLA